MTTSGIVLAVGAPNLCRDGSKTMCSIILSNELGLIRVYPIPAHLVFEVWSVVSVDIERTNSDNRAESWKLINFNITGKVSKADEKRALLDSCCLNSGFTDPIDFQNENRASIAIVKLDYGSITTSLSERIPDVSSGDEEYGWISAQCAHWNKPYITWTSKQEKTHTTHLLGREIYEGLRKNPENPYAIFRNIGLHVPDFERWLVVGNMKDRRNVWVAPHIHRLKKNAFASIPLFSMIPDGRPAGWPYCKQEDFNASAADNQLALFTTDFTGTTASRGSMAMQH